MKERRKIKSKNLSYQLCFGFGFHVNVPDKVLVVKNAVKVADDRDL